MVAAIVSFGALKVTHKKMPQMRWLSPELLLVANKATKTTLFVRGHPTKWLNPSELNTLHGSQRVDPGGVSFSMCLPRSKLWWWVCFSDNVFHHPFVSSLLGMPPSEQDTRHKCTLMHKGRILKALKRSKTNIQNHGSGNHLGKWLENSRCLDGAFVTRLVPEPCEVKVVIEHYPNIRVFAAWCSHHTESRWWFDNYHIFIHFWFGKWTQANGLLMFLQDSWSLVTES